MTLPYERYRALNYTREWLLVNIHNRKLPQYLREEMRALLRHYPVQSELEAIAEDTRYLEAEADALAEMIRHWEEEEIDKGGSS